MAKKYQKLEEQEKLLNYYPPSPIYYPHHEEEILPNLTPQQKIKLDPKYYPTNYITEIEDAPALVNNLMPVPTLEGSRSIIQNVEEDKITEDRKVVVGVTDKEDKSDSYSGSDYTYQSYV